MGMEESLQLPWLKEGKKATPFQPTDMTIKNVIVCKCCFLTFSLLFPSFLPPTPPPPVLTRELNFCVTHLSSMQSTFCTVWKQRALIFSWVRPSPSPVLTECQASSWRDCFLFPGNETLGKDLMIEWETVTCSGDMGEKGLVCVVLQEEPPVCLMFPRCLNSLGANCEKRKRWWQSQTTRPT